MQINLFLIVSNEQFKIFVLCETFSSSFVYKKTIQNSGGNCLKVMMLAIL